LIIWKFLIIRLNKICHIRNESTHFVWKCWFGLRHFQETLIYNCIKLYVSKVLRCIILLAKTCLLKKKLLLLVFIFFVLILVNIMLPTYKIYYLHFISASLVWESIESFNGRFGRTKSVWSHSQHSSRHLSGRW